MKNLPKEIKHMVNLGFWGCYLLEDGNYILSVRNDTYLLNKNGEIIRSHCGYLGDFKAVKPIRFPEIDSSEHPLISVKL
jgi:hypothetical protein